jgi:endonuclease/exonuclease/phosphatase (EEP) superfamily protein YafD
MFGLLSRPGQRDLIRGKVIPATPSDSRYERLRSVVARPLAFYTGVVCVATLLAFAGRWSWFCDLLVNFRTHYALLLAIALGAAVALRCWRVAGVAAVGLALNLWPMHEVLAGSRSPPAAGARSVRLVSFNVHVANGDMARVAAYLESLEADIAVFQELTRAHADQLAALLPRLSHRYPGEDPLAPDVLMLSRWPLVAPQLATRDGLVLAVRADVDLGDRRLRLYGAHLYWPVVPESARVRNAQLAALGRELVECPGPCVVVGDFNITPWSSHYRDLLKNSGVRDCARGQGWLPTWNSKLPAMLRIRIDHCLVAGAIGIESVRVGESQGSDHFATIYDLSVDYQRLTRHEGKRRPEGAAFMRPRTASINDL